ncbi:MAG: DUF5678 domain-containing protein [bacterium]|nr:DUF5678 domain-containing protein [bacterium]MDZ4299954.1 DUF5678 domain-containing protein [Candidatus Sungbacteria bacterium]
MKKSTLPIIDVKKYGGKQVAIVRGKIVASGDSTREVLVRARRKVSPKDKNAIWLLTVPRGLTMVYRL